MSSNYLPILWNQQLPGRNKLARLSLFGACECLRLSWRRLHLAELGVRARKVRTHHSRLDRRAQGGAQTVDVLRAGAGAGARAPARHTIRAAIVLQAAPCAHCCQSGSESQSAWLPSIPPSCRGFQRPNKQKSLIWPHRRPPMRQRQLRRLRPAGRTREAKRRNGPTDNCRPDSLN